MQSLEWRDIVMNMIDDARAVYKLNDYVTYRKSGICRIVDIITQSFAGQGKRKYYVLNSVYDSNTKVFVPVGSPLEEEMGRMLSVDEIHAIIDESNNIQITWADDCKTRAGIFESIIESGDKAKMLCLIKAVSEYKIIVEEQKKKMKATDTKYMALAEGIVSGEFAFPLNIQKNQVMNYIKEYLEKQ